MKNRSVFSLLIVAAMMLAALSPTSAATRLQQKDVDPVVHQVTEVLLDMPVEPPSDLWTSYETASAKNALGQADFNVVDDYFSVSTLDLGQMDQVLAGAPAEFSTFEKRENYQITLPMPDGTLQRFRIWDSPIMEPELAAEFPEIRTFVGQGVDDPTATVRLDRTPAGFHAMVLSAERTVFVDPYVRRDVQNYISYDKRGLRADGERFACLFDPELHGVSDVDSEVSKRGVGSTNVANGTTLRVYSLAMSCTGEYAAFHGGTVAGATAAITTTVNRVNAVYERDLAVRMVLVANNSQLIFLTASSDPFTNDDGGAMLTQNQTTVDSRIGNANYDIGHVVSTGGGGVAYLNCVCRSSDKAGGVTGSGSPIGDAFDIDYVAHEMGHQFGGNHTFNSTLSNCGGGNKNNGTAYEPGSGTTIQAYAGICSTDNVQPNSDDYFHGVSYDEMVAHITGAANACSTQTATGNTPPASVNAGANYTIPVSTPFTLTGSATDANGDAMTYCWEEWDLGTTSTTKPQFRSRRGTTSPSRTFPQMSDILAGTNSTTWEAMPSVARAMKFRLTVRDNRAGGGGVGDSGSSTSTSTTDGYMNVTTASGTTAFAVTAPNTAVSWAGNSSQTVSWSVGGTGAGTTVNCANVKIDVSTNGGTSWSTVVASTANDGSEAITVPNTPSTQCRIRVSAVGNIFFDVSNANFTITAGTGCTYSISPTSASPAAGATTGTVSVTAGAGCAWTATSNAAWLTITSGASGSGNGSTGYSVAANTGAARSGTLTIAGQTFTVNQAAAASCTYSISPTSASPAAGATTGTVSVTAGTGCAWTATSNAAWLTITSGASGSGNGSVGYSVAANTGAARSGTLTIAGQTFTVNQAAGAGCSSGNSAITVNAAATNGSLDTTDCPTTAGNNSAGAYYDQFTFSATTGTVYTITMNSTPVDSYLRLYNGATLITVDDDSNGGTNSKIVYTSTVTGTLTIQCTSYAPSTAGAYTVQVTSLAELVTNGGFDTGVFTPWVAATNSSVVTTAPPQAGTHSARMLGNGTATTTNFYQTIAGFNGTTKTLRFWLKISSAETTTTRAYDNLYVRLKSSTGATLATLGTYTNLNKTTHVNWVQVTLTVPATAVANSRIAFDATEDSSLQTTFNIDGVSIQ